MAGDAVVGALRVVLGADTASLEDGLNGANRALSKFASSSKLAGAAIVTAIAGAVTAVAASVKGMVNEADKFNKASQKFGVPVEELSALAYAAELSDISLEQLGTSLSKLSKNMSAVAGGAGGPAAEAFRKLEIEVKKTDGTLKSSSDVMGEVADSFAGMEDGAGKTALAIAIFGKSGADMIPLLNQGSKGIKTLTDEARELGIVISKETAQAAEDFNDNLTRLGKVSDAIALQLTGELLPGMKSLSAAMVEVAKNSDATSTVASFLSGTLKLMAVAIVGASGVVSQFARDWRLMKEVVGTFSLESIIESFKKWQAESKAANMMADETIKHLLGMQSAILPLIDDWQQLTIAQAAAFKKVPAPIIETKNALDQFIESTQKSIDTQRVEVQTFGMVTGEKEKLKVVLQGLQIAAANNIPVTEAMRAKLLELGTEAGNLALRLQGLMLTQEFLLPWQLYEQQIARLNALFGEGAIKTEVYKAASMKAAAELATAWGVAAQGIVSPVADAFKTLASMNKKYAGIAKAAAIAEALVNTYLGATKAFTAFAANPPLAFAAAAAATAAGLANVAKISATEFAKGGSFTVPGGISGVDTRMVPLNLAAGERVDITPAAQASSGRGGVTTIELQTNRFRDFLTVDNVREMIDAINRAAPDGYVIRMPA